MTVYYVKHYCHKVGNEKETFNRHTTVTLCETMEDREKLLEVVRTHGLHLFDEECGSVSGDFETKYRELYLDWNPDTNPCERTLDQVMVEKGVPRSALYWLNASKDEQYTMPERLLYAHNAVNHLINQILANARK